MTTQDKKIAIIGGGPGGLTLAKLLQLNHADVHVYERDEHKDVRVQGATLDLHEESGLEALKRAGLMDAFIANHRPDAGKLKVLDKNLAIYLNEHESESSHDKGRPEIDRAPLRKILLETLDPETVIWDSQFLSMEKEGEGWSMNFKNGKSYYADIVIAADGANSKLRSYITNIQPVYSGVTIVEGNIYNAEVNAPKLWKLVDGGKLFVLDEEKTLLFGTKADGALTFYTGCKVNENWAQESGIDFSDKEQIFKWFKKEYGTWDGIWQELFMTTDSTFVVRPQYHYPLDQTWETLPNLTMLGDAAHRMPPYAGEGVNMAMQDAYELAECLTSNKYDTVQSALSHYEKQMQKRASEVTQTTLDNTVLMHAPRAIENLMKLFNGE